MITYDVKTKEVKYFPSEESLTIELNIPTEPTPEQRISDMEAQIAQLKSELNVQ